MVGLILQEQYLPFFSDILEESEKYNRAKEEASIAQSYKNGKFGESHKGVISGISGFMKLINQSEGNATLNDIQALLESGKILSLKWRSRRVLTIILSDGTILHVTLKNLHTQDFVFNIDKSLRQTDLITNVAYGNGAVIFLFEDNRLMIARTINKPVEEDAGGFIPEIVVGNYQDFLPPLASRRTEKKISIDQTHYFFVVWWPASKEDVFPWTPRPEDRANILFYRIHGGEMPTLFTYLKTDNKLLEVSFVPNQEQFLTLEEEIDHEGNIVMVEIFYDLSTTSRISETAIPVQSEITCFSYDILRTRLALGCCDSSVVIYSQTGRITLYTKTAFIPVSLSWHPDSFLLFVAGERGQFQIFDIALSPMLLVESGDNSPFVTKEFLSCGPISQLEWSPWPSSSCDCNLLIHFRSGPMIILRFGFGRMGLIELINYYLDSNEICEAIKVLKSIYWGSDDCLMSMYNIFGRLIRKTHSDSVEYELEQLLAVYFVPTYEGDERVRKKHNKSLRILARRFFMWLLQAEKYQRALQVAVSLNEPGLLDKLHRISASKGESGIATSAFRLLQPMLSSSSSGSSSSSCRSGSSFDESSCSSESADCSCDSSQETSEVELEHEVLVPEIIGDHNSPSAQHGQLRVLPLEMEGTKHDSTKRHQYNQDYRQTMEGAQNLSKGNTPAPESSGGDGHGIQNKKPSSWISNAFHRVHLANTLQEKQHDDSAPLVIANPANINENSTRTQPLTTASQDRSNPQQQGQTSSGIQVIHFGVV